MTTLITLGDSWSFGVGVNYRPGMSTVEYNNSVLWDRTQCGQLSWRGLLSSQFELTNVNIALPASSNQQQFRLAKEFFSSKRYQAIKQEKIIVLWGITSTARNEMFDSQTNQLTNFFYTDDTELARAMTKYSYDHDNEVQLLTLEMQHWNSYFSAIGVSNYWFDTFNHHQYREKLPNFLGSNVPGDQMSWLVRYNGGSTSTNTDQYHKSNWKNDDDRVTFLINKGIVNPYSFHPTQLGHQQLCKFFTELCPEFIDS